MSQNSGEKQIKTRRDLVYSTGEKQLSDNPLPVPILLALSSNRLVPESTNVAIKETGQVLGIDNSKNHIVNS